MISRIAWRLVGSPDDLWAKILKGKYFKKTGVLHSKKKSSASWIWKCILQGIEHIKKYSVWEVGNGFSINIWNDKWVPNREQPLVNCTIFNSNITLVSDLINQDTKKWNETLLLSLLTEL